MNKKVKQFISMVMVGLLTIGVMGCSNDTNTGDSSSEGETNKPVEIAIAIEATGDIPTEFSNQIERFNEQHENITVKVLTYSGADTYETAIMGQIAGKSAPDVFWLDGGQKIKTYADNGVIAKLDGLFDDTLSTFEPSILEAFYYNDSLYGIPKDYNTSVLFYNKELLDAAGIQVPATMDEFKKAVQETTKDGVIGFGLDPKINYFYPFVATMGADFVEADGTINKEKLLSDEHIEALTQLKEMFDNEQATSPYLAGAGWDGELFGNNKVALLYAGSWVTGVIEDTSKAGVAPLPVQNEASSMLYVAGWAVSEGSEHKEAAVELIKFLTSDEELVKGNQVGLIGLPPTTTAMDKLIEEQGENPFLPVYREVVKDGVPFGVLEAKFVDTYNKELEKLLYSGQSAEETVENIANAVK